MHEKNDKYCLPTQYNWVTTFSRYDSDASTWLPLTAAAMSEQQKQNSDKQTDGVGLVIGSHLSLFGYVTLNVTVKCPSLPARG